MKNNPLANAPPKAVKCNKNLGNCSYFTDGKVYPVIDSDTVLGDPNDLILVVLDDWGVPRAVNPDGKPSSHDKLMKRNGANAMNFVPAKAD